MDRVIHHDSDGDGSDDGCRNVKVEPSIAHQSQYEHDRKDIGQDAEQAASEPEEEKHESQYDQKSQAKTMDLRHCYAFGDLMNQVIESCDIHLERAEVCVRILIDSLYQFLPLFFFHLVCSHGYPDHFVVDGGEVFDFCATRHFIQKQALSDSFPCFRDAEIFRLVAVERPVNELEEGHDGIGHWNIRMVFSYFLKTFYFS